MRRSVLQLVPRRTLIPDGVGDYATLLADTLDRCAGLSSVFVQGADSQSAPPRIDGWSTTAMSVPCAKGLKATLSELTALHHPIAVLVHISLYGYQKRGIPTWLVAEATCATCSYRLHFPRALGAKGKSFHEFLLGRPNATTAHPVLV
jgi:hypothetical protein